MKYVVYMDVGGQWINQRSYDWFKRGAFNFALDLAEANPGKVVHVVGERPNYSERVLLRVASEGMKL